MKTIQYLGIDGKLSSACKHKISNKDLLKIYEVMEQTRIMDERMLTLQRQGVITFAMSSRGEEACAAASAAALNLEDWLFPQYREAACMFWRDYPMQSYIHQMFGNGKDPILGRQMPNHFGHKDYNVLPVSSPLGTQITHAAGAAYAMKLAGDKSVCLTYFGDGCASKEDFHAALNFAAVKRSPVIFFCRNNGYAISTKVCDQFATPDLAMRGLAYGMETFQVDGNDVFAIHETVSNARKLCLQGKGPVFIEAMTYRMGAHSTSDDPSCYRKDSEVKNQEKFCPIKRLRSYLVNKKILDPAKEEKLMQEVKERIETAIEEAKNTAPPPIESLIEDVYFETPQYLRSQLSEAQLALANVEEQSCQS